MFNCTWQASTVNVSEDVPCYPSFLQNTAHFWLPSHPNKVKGNDTPKNIINVIEVVNLILEKYFL